MSLQTTLKKQQSKVKKTFKQRYLRVYSRHPSHRPLRNSLLLPVLSVIRLGSTTKGNLPYAVEINSPEGVKNASSKLLMKKRFSAMNVKTADWYIYNQGLKKFAIADKDNNDAKALDVKELPYPIIAKSHYGSRGKGNTKIDTAEAMILWLQGKNTANYIFEKYYNYNKEYRLHVSENGCFYTCRKVLKKEFKDQPNSWQRHDDNCSWLLENNAEFDKPKNWDKIVEQSVKALKAVGLDIGAVDLRVQNNTTEKGKPREDIDFIIVEINSAPSMGEITLIKYKEEIPKIVKRKLTL